MEDGKVKKIIRDIEGFVEKEISRMNPSQLNTLKALLFSGYKGERDIVLLELLELMGEKKITKSPLVESYTSTQDNIETTYWRISPEFFRAARAVLLNL